MARDTNDAVERLNKIWREWSLGREHDVMKAQRASLPMLESLLHEGHPSTILRAVQALLTNPEWPGAHNRILFNELWKSVDEQWVGAGTKPDDVQQLQAMLLAAWPRERRSAGFGLLPMLMSPWEIMGGREVQKPQLELWWEEAVWEESNEEQEAEGQEDGASAPESTDDVEEDEDEFEQDEDEVEENETDDDSDVGEQVNSPQRRVGAKIRQVGKQVQIIAMNELLWWGQARYCHTLRQPFRRVADSEQRLWWTAWEAAERAQALPVEPAAAYLQEVLHSLGHDLDESRPLREWMRALHESLAQSPTAKSVCEPLAALASKDALALPVTWVRLQTGHEMNLEQAADAVALPLDTSIDRGQWAAWIFRELLLDHSFAEAR